MTAIKRIAVIGATGMLGLPVTAALARAGFAVGALVRNPDAARKVLPEEIEVIAADVRDVASLERGLQGYDALYLSLSIAQSARPDDFHTEAQGLENILAAAHAAGIKRIGYLSALVHDTVDDWWVLKVWRQAIARIKASGIDYTIFYAGNLMETLAQRHNVAGHLMMIGSSHQPHYWLAGADLGRQVASAFASPRAADREYVMQGPEPVPYCEALKRYARARAKGALVFTVPLWVLRGLGIFRRDARFNARMMRTVLRYPEVFTAGPAWDELGRPTTTIEAFAKGA
jgi:uncharacterized protein YbjT (DUF2867 family)